MGLEIFCHQKCINFWKWGQTVRPQFWGRLVPQKLRALPSGECIVQGKFPPGDESSSGHFLLATDHPGDVLSWGRFILVTFRLGDVSSWGRIITKIEGMDCHGDRTFGDRVPVSSQRNVKNLPASSIDWYPDEASPDKMSTGHNVPRMMCP
jgi:hypothetical protein